LESQSSVTYHGTGRRKSAIAQVRIVPGTGQLTINGRPGVPYLQYNPSYLWAVQAPLDTLGVENNYDTIVKTKGGGLTGQAQAITLGLARALCSMNSAYRQPLKARGYLTRNPLRKERKKYGLKKARKAPQFSKR
jgi:small subunit ribosomal protein S9